MSRFRFVLLAMFVAGNLPVTSTGQESAAIPENAFLPKEARNGLFVHLGSKDDVLPLELAKGNNWLMHVLVSDDPSLMRARQAINVAGLAGRVGVERGSVTQLPYADNLINVLMIDNIEETLEQGLSHEEILRVLAPRGTAFLGYGSKQPPLTGKQLQAKLAARGIKTSDIVEANGVWARITKPPLTGADEWTHYQYDPAGNPVSRDRLAGPPTGLRWLAGPSWPVDRNGPLAAVTSHGRLFYAEDNAPGKQKGKLIPTLFARDAHNGLLLWQKPAPGFVRLAFIATPSHLYTVITPKGPLVALDAASGELRQTYAAVLNPSWVMLVQDKLLAFADGQLKCIDLKNGQPLWKNSGHNITPALLRYPNAAVEQDQVFFADSQKRVLGCLDLRTGKDIWQNDISAKMSGSRVGIGIAAYQNGVLVVGEWDKTMDGKGVHAFSAKDGKHLWSHNFALLHSGRAERRKAASCLEGFFIDGLYWIHVGNPDARKGDSWQGLDPATGVVKKRFAYPPDLRVAESCQPAQATVNYLIGGHREFVDTRSGKYEERAEGVHGGCLFGMLTANGLTYTWSRYTTTFLRAEMGLESHGQSSTGKADPEGARLQRGTPVAVTSVKSSADDWPCYRHDPALSASSPTRLPDYPVVAWQAKVGRKLSPPVAVGDSVFVADVEEHRVLALDADSGKTRWSYTAGGRIPLPPTIHQGMCLFGSNDGNVYCLDAKTGELIWRFRAAPQERRIVVHGQMESPWPVAGGVQVADGRAYFSAGRHGSLDGGVHLFAVEPATGKILWSKHLRDAPVVKLLASDGVSITMGGKSRYSLKTGEHLSAKAVSELVLSSDSMSPIHVFGTATILDRLEATGDVLALAKTGNFGVLATGPTANSLRKMKMAKDGIASFPERLGEKQGGELIIFSLPDGKKSTRLKLDATPVFDGLIAARSRLYLSTQDGRMICIGKK